MFKVAMTSNLVSAGQTFYTKPARRKFKPRHLVHEFFFGHPDGVDSLKAFVKVF